MSTQAESSFSSLISYPTPETAPILPVASTSKAQAVQERLFIGNLHPTVDEYSLLKIFSKYGNVTKLDFLFHKTGLLKGKPRGYAFVEFQNKDDAMRALSALHDKPLRGRNLVVTHANQQSIPDMPLSSAGGVQRTLRKPVNDSGKPTMLSMIKSNVGGSSAKHRDATKDKIARLEAKLSSMNPSTATSRTELTHPSLPAKPPPPSADGTQPSLPQRPSHNSSTLSRPASLPSAPTPLLSSSHSVTSTPGSQLMLLPTTSTRKPRTTLAGVRLKKPAKASAAASPSTVPSGQDPS